MNRIIRLAWLAFVCPLLNSAQPPAPTVPVRVLVSVGHYHSDRSPTLKRDDLIVTLHDQPAPVTNLTPLRGDRGGLQLFLLVDNCSNWEPGSGFEELRRFILSQPPATAVGVANIQDGRLQVAENPTKDHERAARALNTHAGCKPSSPFVALAKLIRDWPQGPSRRAVLLISNGVDPTAREQMPVPSAQAAIEASQRAGVTLYAIYHPSADYRTTASSMHHLGQIQLAHVAVETGGEAYFSGLGPLPLLSPLLADIADQLANQYLVEFVAPPAEGSGALQEVAVHSAKIRETELTAPYKVWVPGQERSRLGDNGEGLCRRSGKCRTTAQAFSSAFE
jgi:hypothetical protein